MREPYRRGTADGDEHKEIQRVGEVIVKERLMRILDTHWHDFLSLVPVTVWRHSTPDRKYEMRIDIRPSVLRSLWAYGLIITIGYSIGRTYCSWEQLPVWAEASRWIQYRTTGRTYQICKTKQTKTGYNQRKGGDRSEKKETKLITQDSGGSPRCTSSHSRTAYVLDWR
ncbi:hypothetical protein B0H13DRAFT_1911188 [Mycena leptocephala]|nr:hypothetical protein B0H13DRAFT_1911188 [Mycena leptocephala]